MPLRSRSDIRTAFETSTGNTGWHGQQNKGDVVRVEDVNAANDRIGHCAMRGRLKHGDLLLCYAHSGDNFFNYVPIERIGNGYKVDWGLSFGAYAGIGDVVAEFSKDAILDLIERDFVPYSEGAPAYRAPAKPKPMLTENATGNAGEPEEFLPFGAPSAGGEP